MKKQLRYFLKSLLVGVTVRVRSGPLKGMRWSLFTGVRFIRGDYSQRVLPRLLDQLRPGAVFYDIGAHIGYYTLCAAKTVGGSGQVVAFEPLPLNIKYLHRHLRINAVDNVKLIPAAVSIAGGKIRFDGGRGTGRGHIGASGSYVVDAVCIDDMVGAGRIPPPDVIKMDVEGAEFHALQGAKNTLSRYRPTVFVSLHGEAAQRDCLAFFASLGYAVQRLGRSDILATAMSAGREADTGEPLTASAA